MGTFLGVVGLGALAYTFHRPASALRFVISAALISVPCTTTAGVFSGSAENCQTFHSYPTPPLALAERNQPPSNDPNAKGDPGLLSPFANFQKVRLIGGDHVDVLHLFSHAPSYRSAGKASDLPGDCTTILGQYWGWKWLNHP